MFSRDGRRADLFNIRHYPVRAVCQDCGEPIEAESFFRPFLHAEAPLAAIIQFPLRGAVA